MNSEFCVLCFYFCYYYYIKIIAIFCCSDSNSCSITCSYKASNGLLYPLERGFIFVHKPAVHIRFEEIANVNFARGSTTGRTFDFEIELKHQGSAGSSTVTTFSSLPRFVDIYLKYKIYIRD